MHLESANLNQTKLSGYTGHRRCNYTVGLKCEEKSGSTLCYQASSQASHF